MTSYFGKYVLESFPQPLLGGYMGRILRINLTKLIAKAEPLSKELILNFIGGRGFCIKIIYDETSPETKPLGPENKLVIAVGPLTGTGAQGAGRWVAAFKSPLTGIYMRSTGGGLFGAELKFAGYDAIVVEGRAEKPTYVWVNEDEVEFRDASQIWNMASIDAAQFMKDETDKNAKAVIVGPAGENLVKTSAIVTDDSRTAARGGGGAVMGSKNLKGIVVKGSRKVSILHEDVFREVERERFEKLRNDPHLWPDKPDAFRGLGTNSSTYLWYLMGHLPSYNFNQWELPSVEAFRPENLVTYRVGHKGCYGCALRCGKVYKTRYGKYAAVTWEFPELETEWALGAVAGHCNVDAIVYANMLCDLYGLDTISTGSAIAFAIELYQNGILTKAETDGLELRWGDPDSVVELIKKIAFRIGYIGNVLAEGTRRASRIIGRGAEQFAMQIKGLEMPAYDPRVMKGQGIGIATSTIGASHAVTWNKFEIVGEPRHVDPLAVEGKAELVKYVQDELAVCETAVFCKIFINHDIANPWYFAKELHAVTGEETFKDPDYVWRVGERIWNLERAYSNREGINANDDSYPARLLKPYPREPYKGQMFEQEKLKEEYYRVRGWDMRGIPTTEKLKDLNLVYVTEDFKKKGLI